jgi:hypothetical protein
MNNTIKGILILVEYDHGNYPNKIGDICKFPYGLNIAGKNDMGYPVIKPIIISETEQIKLGDWVYDLDNGIVKIENEYQLKNINLLGIRYTWTTCFKIIANHENFSDKHKQMIVDGSLKDKMEVLIDSITKFREITGTTWDGEEVSKFVEEEHVLLNEMNHITIHQIEQPKFTVEEFIDYIDHRFTRDTPVTYVIRELQKGDLTNWIRNK